MTLIEFIQPKQGMTSLAPERYSAAGECAMAGGGLWPPE